MNIKIKVDGTDHFGLFCPECNLIMKVTSVYTDKSISGDNCSRIWAICKKCKYKGQRKIYWNSDGEFLE